MVLSKDGEGITDPYSAMAYLPNNHTNHNMHTPTYKASKAVFGSCKIFSGKYVFSGNAIFRKGKYFQVFGCIMKIFLENIFMCLGVF